MPITQLPPERTWGSSIGQAFMNYMRGKQMKRQQGMEEQQFGLKESIGKAQEEYYRARAEGARDPQIHTPHYIAQVLGKLQTGSSYSPLGIPMETLTERQEHLDYATKKFGPDWENSIAQALAIINKKFPITETAKPEQPPRKGKVEKEPITKQPVKPETPDIDLQEMVRQYLMSKGESKPKGLPTQPQPKLEFRGYGEPKTENEFKNIYENISDPDEAEQYFQKWKDKFK